MNNDYLLKGTFDPDYILELVIKKTCEALYPDHVISTNYLWFSVTALIEGKPYDRLLSEMVNHQILGYNPPRPFVHGTYYLKMNGYWVYHSSNVGINLSKSLIRSVK